jgi:hypothetical protein
MILRPYPIVDFDPTKKEHRAAANAFLRRGAWMDSPLRFSHDSAFSSVSDQVRAKLLNWYVNREFKATV